MYFQRFPKTLYSLDDRTSLQLVTSIFIRVAISDDIKNNLSVFDEYDIKDGETPEILADIFYGDSQLHWIILHVNEILDPRFDWPLSTSNFRKYVENKYPETDSIHHYEDADGNQITGRIYVNSAAGFTSFVVGDVIKNQTSQGTGLIVEKQNTSNVTVQVSDGGFKTNNQIYNVANVAMTANITATFPIVGTPVTVYGYEDQNNESKRRIKILKPQYVDAVIREFNQKLEQING